MFSSEVQFQTGNFAHAWWCFTAWYNYNCNWWYKFSHSFPIGSSQNFNFMVPSLAGSGCVKKSEGANVSFWSWYFWFSFRSFSRAAAVLSWISFCKFLFHYVVVSHFSWAHFVFLVHFLSSRDCLYSQLDGDAGTQWYSCPLLLPAFLTLGPLARA